MLLAERASILSSLHDALLVSDATGAVVEVNDRWTELTGFTAEESVGLRLPYPWWPLSEDDADVSFRAIIRAAMGRGGPAAASRMKMMRPSFTPAAAV